MSISLRRVILLALLGLAVILSAILSTSSAVTESTRSVSAHAALR